MSTNSFDTASNASQVDLSGSPLKPEDGERVLRHRGYVVGFRDPDIKPGIAGKFMVYDPSDEDGFCIVGDDRNDLILDAIKSLGNMLDMSVLDEVSDDDLLSKDFGIVSQGIGFVDLDGGRDEYVLLTRKDGEDLTPDLAERWLLLRVYREGSGPGTRFCHAVRAVQKKGSENACICTIEHRLDI